MAVVNNDDTSTPVLFCNPLSFLLKLTCFVDCNCPIERRRGPSPVCYATRPRFIIRRLKLWLYISASSFAHCYEKLIDTLLRVIFGSNS